MRKYRKQLPTYKHVYVLRNIFSQSHHACKWTQGMSRLVPSHRPSCAGKGDYYEVNFEHVINVVT